ncbi:MAG: 5'-methylthioadenosine/adenosylhomocysteine nucleosidase [Coprobacillus sp.]
MIGIIGAEDEEIAQIKKYIKINNVSKHQDYTFFEGLIDGKGVVLLHGGIGKVNAAVATTLLFTHYEIDYVINIGSAGGLYDNQSVGDVVISTAVVHHDVDITAFGRQLGELPGLPVHFEADPYLCECVCKVLNKMKMSFHSGLMTSGDQFIASEQQIQKIKKDFPEAICVEMEAAAIAQVCYVFNKKFIITRSLSDVYEKGKSKMQFDEYLKKASKVSAKMCYELILML